MENVEKVCIEGAKVIRRMQVSGVFFLEFFYMSCLLLAGGCERGCASSAAPLSALFAVRMNVPTLLGRLVRNYQNFFVFWIVCKKNMKILYLSHYSAL